MDDENKNKAEEPLHSYRKISISTLEQQGAEQIAYWASLTPEQRFNDFYELMNRFFDLKESHLRGSKIIFDK